MLSLPRPLWQVLVTTAIREEGMVLQRGARISAGLTLLFQVEFKVNDERQDFAMKLGEGGEAFFVFETTSPVPQGLQTSPVVSPASSPAARPSTGSPVPDLEPLDLAIDIQKRPELSRPASVAGTLGLGISTRPSLG